MKQNFLPRNKNLKERATSLRNNATEEGNHLWFSFLRKYPVRFNRQRIIGNYIVDFYCNSAKLVVELDGSQHFDDDGIRNDRLRTGYLESLGLKVLRFSNLEIKQNFYEVCSLIDYEVNKAIGKSESK